jgi:hypothetical protein
MRDGEFLFSTKVPPPAIEYQFKVVSHDGKTFFTVSDDKFRPRGFEPHTQQIVVPTEAFDNFVREYAKNHGTEGR